MRKMRKIMRQIRKYQIQRLYQIVKYMRQQKQTWEKKYTG